MLKIVSKIPLLTVRGSLRPKDVGVPIGRVGPPLGDWVYFSNSKEAPPTEFSSNKKPKILIYEPLPRIPSIT
jgi:hypothetical protein